MSPRKLDDPAWRKNRATVAARAAHSLSTLIGRIERRRDELTPEEWDRIDALTQEKRPRGE